MKTGKDRSLLDNAVAGYSSIAGGRERLTSAKRFISQHKVLFTLCHELAFFHWTDVQAVDAVCRYLQNLL